MNEYLSFVSIDQWTLIFTWINLLILFLLLKKFLFKPINEILDKRAEEIDKAYADSESIKADALRLKNEYDLRLNSAKGEAENIINTARKSAQKQSEDIIESAKNEAMQAVRKSQTQIRLERETAIKKAQSETASMAVDIAEKLIGRTFDNDKDKELIEDIIGRI